MTKSAKQDPVKATADAAEPEPAATAGDGEEATQEAASQETASPAATAAPDGAAGEEAKPDLDEVKRKFREALDRKHDVHAEGQAKGGRDANKGIHGSHGPAASRRSFRRKSG